MKNVVVDTNIIISAAISVNGNPAVIMDLVSDKAIQAYYNDEILDEYKRVLAYERLKIDPAKQVEIIEKIKEVGILIKPEKSNLPLPDESDRIFYDTAQEVGAILITGNIKHYPDEEFILTPSEYIKLIAEE
ncbi:MAG: putative toxin-antitoxin system toxin component, PIN family [Oscillospiraceae bacterium]|nr:putative toxin-antitoxin system toxin component, PIN family [Oscillospiraceae bacterium]